MRGIRVRARRLRVVMTEAELTVYTTQWCHDCIFTKRLLKEWGVPYREIHDRTLVSVTTIGRVARTFERGAGGYAAALKRRGSR